MFTFKFCHFLAKVSAVLMPLISNVVQCKQVPDYSQLLSYNMNEK